MKDFYSFETAQKILRYKHWAMVGASSDPSKASNGVMRFLLDQGYDVVPVNPNEDKVHGVRCYPELCQVPEGRIEVVDIFRRSDQVSIHVDEAIDIGAKAIWMQIGVVDEAAARRAHGVGVEVVMDRCPRMDIPSLLRSRA